MSGLIGLFKKRIIPFMSKLSDNDWIKGLNRSRLMLFPMVLIGSLVSVYMVLYNYSSHLPNLMPIKDYTYGLMSLFMVFMIPYYILSYKGISSFKHIAGCAGISMYMIIAKPLVTESGHVYDFSHFGPDGMLVAIIAGLLTSSIFLYFSQHIVFKKYINYVPDSFREAFVSIVPVAITVFIAWFFVIYLNFDLYNTIIKVMMPLQGIAQGPIGFTILVFLPMMLHSMGISSWILQPLILPVVTKAILLNMNAGGHNIFTNETLIAYINFGGKGATLGLVILLMFSKSKRLKALGATSLVPALVNIGEPITFGLVVWNPIMMIPMWINGLVLPLLTYLWISLGLAPVPIVQSSQWFLPIGVGAVVVTQSWFSLVLVIVNLVVSTLIWYPFFKYTETRILKSLDDKKDNELKRIESV
ncbi:PTS transporter subunit EIIC [Erysipelothrix urinaevulpis]|uniref:PTS transporter subunit EIIC n=1 Tax=Erysipelothrix urinaevulpis TaxID=2683717 RepID=UPI0013597CE9|nr:PTS transporter subunit EIIC [Erysipelothrix urinaevulpis]